MAVAAAVIDAYNRHDLVAFERLHSYEARIEFAGHPEDIGLGEWISVLDGLFKSLPDLTIHPVTVLADDATVVIEMRQVGTNTGGTDLDDATRAFFGVDAEELAPTGRTVDVPGVVVLTLADGAVVGERHHWPPQWLWQQLGLVTLEAVPTGDVAHAAAGHPLVEEP